jgi:hypothetical protein
MRYRLYSNSTREPCDVVEMHVLARAYRAAWRCLHACEPSQRHVLAALDLLIDFGPQPEPPAAARERPTPPTRGRG